MKKRIIIISDGIGDTAREIVDCTMAQFSNVDTNITKYTKVTTTEQVDKIFEIANSCNALLIYTVAEKLVRDRLEECLKSNSIEFIDILGPMINKVGNHIKQEPKLKSGLHRALDENYFTRVAAMEFTLNNDDGRKVENIKEADIILVGVSRTSKTPLSMYLSMQGYKTINIPLIINTQIPSQLFEADQSKIFALTISPDNLTKIRSQRLNQLYAKHYHGDYANYSEVVKELEWANTIYQKNSIWPVFDVSNKAIEETAAEIIKLMKLKTTDFF